MQVPAPFDYERATSVDEAIHLLERLGEEARLVAGGHSLIPMMKLRLANLASSWSRRSSPRCSRSSPTPSG